MEPELKEQKANAQGDQETIEREKKIAEDNEQIVSMETFKVEGEKNKVQEATDKVQIKVNAANIIIK